MGKRKLFRFFAATDILLLKETVAVNPQSPEAWKTVAKNLNALATPKFEVEMRSCKDRVERLVKQYKAEDRANLRKSGTDEEFAEKESLLQEIVELWRENEARKQQLVTPDVRKAATDRDVAAKIRNAALLGLVPTNKDPELSEDDLADNPVIKSPKMSRLSKPGVLSYLEEKSKLEAQVQQEQVAVKREEVANRRTELELRREELDLQRQRFEQEKEEAKAKRELERQERVMMIDLIKTFANK